MNCYYFTLPETVRNRAMGIEGVDYGTYEAYAIKVPSEAEIRSAYEKVKEQADKGSANEISNRAWEEVRASNGFRSLADWFERQYHFMIGTLPPTPSTDFKVIVFGLKPKPEYFVPLEGYPKAYTRNLLSRE